MAVVRWVIVALAAALAVVSIVAMGFRAGGAPRGGAQLWTCPMHPSVVQDHPGECPICSMTLVPRTAAVPHSEQVIPGRAPVDLTPERIQLVGMRTARVTRESKGGELRATGVVAPSERGLAQITTRFAGWVDRLFVAETGQRVRKGEALATIYSPDVLKAQQELLVARGWKGSEHDDPLTAGLADSARQRLELLGISPREIDEVVRSGKPVPAITIRSPADGFVVTRSAVVGLAVQPGTVLFDVADLRTVWVNAEVYEQDIDRVRVGQAGRFELPSGAGPLLTGKVKQVSPVLDAQSRTVRVRLELPNRFDASGPRLRPGMYGTVYLALPPTTGLMVPAEAVVDTGERKYLFLVTGPGHFEPRPIDVGGRVRDLVEVTRGVKEGETVVTTGNFLIDSESRLRAAVEGAR
jgi:Cu(I)/Ag(I) efflux system membrane fusion protein